MLTLANPAVSDRDFATHPCPDLHDHLRELRAFGPVVPVMYLGAPAWLVLAHAEGRAVFGDDVHFDAAVAYAEYAVPPMGRVLQALSGDEHTQQRALASGPFLPGAVRRLIEPIADKLLDDLAVAATPGEPVDLVWHFTSRLPFTVISTLLSVPVEHEKKFLEMAVALFTYPWDPEGALAARKEFDAFFAPILAEHRACPRGDFISMVMDAESDGIRASDEQVMALLRMLVPAGSDTTWKALGSMFAAVLGDSRLRALACRGERERAAIAAESVRREPPVAIMPRACSQSAQLGGAQIKTGERVLVAIAAANRDPAVFDHPGDFDPDRNTAPILSFGGGRHFCLGTHLARREMETALDKVLKRFPDMKLAPDKVVEITGTNLRGPRELWVTL